MSEQEDFAREIVKAAKQGIIAGFISAIVSVCIVAVVLIVVL